MGNATNHPTALEPDRIYLLTRPDGRIMVMHSAQTAHGVALDGEYYVVGDNLVREAYWQVGPVTYLPSPTPYALDNLRDVGSADDYEAFAAATALQVRTNCQLDAPADYRHWNCERSSPTPCVLDPGGIR